MANICEVIGILLDLNGDLATRIRLMTFWSTEPRVSIQLDPVAESLNDLALWAQRNGGAIVARVCTCKATGEQYRSCKVVLDVDNHRVEIYTHLPIVAVEDDAPKVDCT
jgi:hypothetical protein